MTPPAVTCWVFRDLRVVPGFGGMDLDLSLVRFFSDHASSDFARVAVVWAPSAGTC